MGAWFALLLVIAPDELSVRLLIQHPFQREAQCRVAIAQARSDDQRATCVALGELNELLHQHFAVTIAENPMAKGTAP